MNDYESGDEKTPRPSDESHSETCPRCGQPIRGLVTKGPGETYAQPCGCWVADLETAVLAGDDEHELVADGGQPLNDPETVVLTSTASRSTNRCYHDSWDCPNAPERVHGHETSLEAAEAKARPCPRCLGDPDEQRSADFSYHEALKDASPEDLVTDGGQPTEPPETVVLSASNGAERTYHDSWDCFQAPEENRAREVPLEEARVRGKRCSHCAETAEGTDGPHDWDAYHALRDRAEERAESEEEERLVTDGGVPDDKVVLTAARNSDDDRSFHESYECGNAPNPDDSRVVPRVTAKRVATPCGRCLGEQPHGIEQDHSYRRLLEETSPEEFDEQIATDGGLRWADLSATERDVLAALVRAEADHGADVVGSSVKLALRDVRTDTDEATVYRILRSLEAAGWVDVEETRPGRENYYRSRDAARELLRRRSRGRLEALEERAKSDGGELVADGGRERGEPPGSPTASAMFDRWTSKAAENLDEWGFQDEETLLLAAQEELGELTQAYLEARAEDGNPARVERELVDLGALLIQLHEARNRHEFDDELLPDGGGSA